MAKFLDLTGLTKYTSEFKTWITDRFVPLTRKINGKTLDADITLSAEDVQAIPASQKGAASGVASLDENGQVPSAQLPSYVDDVLEVDNYEALPDTGESGKIYVTKDTNKSYRWSGSAYVEISKSIVLGETSSTAFAGDKGKIAYDHSQLQTGNPHSVTKADVGLGNVDNVKQIAGLASGTTPDHVVTFGENGYSVKDSGFTIASNVPADAKFTDTVYTHPAGQELASGMYKITTDANGHVSVGTAITKDDITGLGIPGAVPTKVSELTNDSGYQTAANVNSIVDGKGFLTSIPEEYVTDTELTGKGYQTASQVETAITGKGYQTSTQVQTAITTAIEGLVSEDDLVAITEEEIEAIFTS